MNLKKLKRLTSVVLSLSMVLSMDMAGFAAEAAPAGVPSHEHVLVVDESQGVAATCGEDGVEVLACECGYSEQNIIEATGDHTEEDTLDGATNEVVTSCTVCGKELGRAPYEDNYEVMPLAEGDTAGGTAAASTAPEDCNNPSIKAVSRVASTCFTQGMAAHYKCETCENLFRTKASAEAHTGAVTEADLKIAKLNHNSVTHAKVDPTCTEGGSEEYVTCEICERKYATVEDLYDDIEDKNDPASTCLSDTEIAALTLPALGHTYKTTDDDGTETSTIQLQGWDEFEPEDYEAGKACGIDATRSCTRCEEHYSQTATSVSVTLIQPESGPYDCEATDGIDVSYEITAIFTNDAKNPSETASSTDTEKVTKTKHVTGHSYTYRFEWPAQENDVFTADGAGKLALSATDKVTLESTCAVCGDADPDADSIDATLTAVDSSIAIGDPLKCYPETKSFTASATVGTNTITSDPKELTLPVGNHALSFKDYVEATCDAAGNEPYYYCTNNNCGAKFWDEEGTDPVKETESVDIPKLGHNIMPPKYSFKGDTDIVEATFRCMRADSCHAEVTKLVPEGNVKLDEPEITDTTASCSQEIDVAYPVSIPFDRNVVKYDETKGWYEDIDDPQYDPDYTYGNGKVTRKEKVQHKFNPVKYDWAGAVETVGSTDYYNPEDGIVATLTCSKCGGVAKIGSAGVTPDMSSITNAITLSSDATLELGELDTDHSDYLAATCSTGGVDVYSVTLKGQTGDAAATPINDTGSIPNNTKQSGHKYIITENSMVVEDDLDATTGKPVISAMNISCAVEDCTDNISIDYTPANANGLTVDFLPVTDEEDPAYKDPASCTVEGKKVWKVDITVDNDSLKAYETYDGNWVGTPKVIEKDDPATGHNFDVALIDADWDWSEFGADDGNNNFVPSNKEGALVYGTYKCQNPNCDGEMHTATEPEGTNTTYDKGADGTRYKKVGVEPTDDNTPGTSCGTSGKTITYTATITKESGIDTSTRTQTTTGHVWDDIVWGTWTDAGTTEPVTIGDKTFEQEVYSITASRTCRNCSDTESFSTTADPTSGSIIEITSTTDPNTCTGAGSTIYWATLTIKDGNGNTTDTIENPLPGVHVYPATGHKYQINWTWTADVKMADGSTESKTGSDIVEADVLRYTGATAEKVCANGCGKEIALDTAYGKDGVEFVDNNGKISCISTDVFTYTAKAKFVDDADDVYTDMKNVIHLKKDRHDYRWELSGWDPTAGTVTVKATCNDNDEHTFTAKNVPFTVTGESSSPATCVSGPKTSVTGTFTVKDTEDNGKEYAGSGTYESVDGAIDEDAHDFASAVIDWAAIGLPLTSGTVDEEKGTITYELTAKAACTLDETEGKTHTRDVPVLAVADIDEVDAICCTDNYTINYALSLKNADADKDITLADGAQKSFSHTAEASHVGPMKREAAVEGDCVTGGHSTYYECQECHKRYNDVSGKYLYTDDVTAPLGHRYGNPVYFWNVEGEKVSARFTCNRAGCQDSYEGHTRTFGATVDVDAAGKPVKYTEAEATCANAPEPKDGLDYYMVTLELPNTVDSSQFSSMEYHGDVPVVVPAGDHVAGTDDPTKCKYCGRTIADQVKVIFKNAAGEDYVIRRFAVGTAADEITGSIPAGPNRSGYTFKGWGFSTTDDEADIADAIAAKIATGSSLADIQVYPVYTENAVSGKVVAQYVQEVTVNDTVTLKPIEGQENIERSGSIGSRVDLAAGNVGDLVFSYWAEVDGAGNITVLSTSSTYSIFITSAATRDIKAVFVSDESDKKAEAPTVAMTDKYATGSADAADVHKISFVATADVPSTCTVVESGILYSTNEEAGSDPSVMVVGSENTKVKRSVFDSGNGTNILTLNVGANASNWGKNIYARGYVIYTEGNSTEQKIVYSAIDYGSFNGLLGDAAN